MWLWRGALFPSKEQKGKSLLAFKLKALFLPTGIPHLISLLLFKLTRSVDEKADGRLGRLKRLLIAVVHGQQNQDMDHLVILHREHEKGENIRWDSSSHFTWLTNWWFFIQEQEKINERGCCQMNYLDRWKMDWATWNGMLGLAWANFGLFGDRTFYDASSTFIRVVGKFH